MPGHVWLGHVSDPPVLVLAGAQKGEYRKLRREAEKRGLEGKVLFPGFIRDDDLPAVYSAAALFVFPSLYEGFGLPPLEAMACGTPCVVLPFFVAARGDRLGRHALQPHFAGQPGGVRVRVLTEPDLYESFVKQDFASRAVSRGARRQRRRSRYTAARSPIRGLAGYPTSDAAIVRPQP